MFIFREHLWSNAITSNNILDMPEWKIECVRLCNRIFHCTKMPNAVCNVVAEYSGSVYAAILKPLGSDDEFRRRVRECFGRPNKQQLAAASKIMKILIAKIGARTSKKYTRREIHRMVSSIGQYSVNPDFVTGLCQYRVFYRILLTYFA